MQSIVLAATHETAHNSLGREVPRPLLDLGHKGEPMLAVLVRVLGQIPGLTRIVVVTNESILREIRDCLEPLAGPVPTLILSDGTLAASEQLGAIGDTIFALEKVEIRDEDLLLVGGSNWFAYDLLQFVRSSKDHSPAVIVSRISRDLDPSRFGMVEKDVTDRVVRFTEKPAGASPGFKAACIYYFSASDLRWFRVFVEEKNAVRCAPGKFFEWLASRTQVWAREMAIDLSRVRTPEEGLPSVVGPDYLRVRELIRGYPERSLWQQAVATKMEWVSSYEDLVHVIRAHRDPNHRIWAALILGGAGGLLNEEGRARVVDALREALDDAAYNDYGIDSQDDEEALLCVGGAAASSLVRLGYAATELEVLDKAQLPAGHHLRGFFKLRGRE